MTHYEAQILPKQKVTRKLIEEIYSSPPPPARPNPVKLKPSRYAQLPFFKLELQEENYVLLLHLQSSVCISDSCETSGTSLHLLLLLSCLPLRMGILF